MLKIAITGGSGQLARAILERCSCSPNSYTAFSHNELDICNIESIESAISGYDIVINCAAYTNVELAEDEPVRAFEVNSNGVANLTYVCKKIGAKLIHISTDYVFDGSKHTPYIESDVTNPINTYGKSKVSGENEALKISENIIIRTSWLYSPWNKNFCRTILNLAKTQARLEVVNDQRGTPTSALDVADMLISIIDKGSHTNMSGIYHYTAIGECSWFDFASEIIKQSNIGNCTVVPCSTNNRPTKARRPAYSVLSTERTSTIKDVKLNNWQQALGEVLSYINE